jgi:ABC-type nitrate/sulfonate/bicarbonate transport system substrate-binding protein
MKKHTKPVLHLPRREVLRMGGYGVLGLMIAAGTRNVAHAQTPDLETLKANLSSFKMGEFNANYATQWSYRLAQAHGYYEDIGITDFEVILSDEYLPGLIGGSLDITHGDTSVFLGAANASGLPIKQISMYRDKEFWIMGVRAGIETPEDLKGKKITGGQLDGRNTWVMKKVLAKMGLDPENDVEFVPTSGGSDNRLAAVINGTIDAASMFPRHEAALVGAGGKFLHKELTEAPQEGFGTMQAWLDANEDTAYAWVHAELKARRWLFDPANEERAYQIMVDLGYEIPDSFRALYQVELSQISPDGGFESAEVMDQFLSDLAETGDVPAGMDWRKVLDMTYVWAAQDALGLERRPASL